MVGVAAAGMRWLLELNLVTKKGYVWAIKNQFVSILCSQNLNVCVE